VSYPQTGQKVLSAEVIEKLLGIDRVIPSLAPRLLSLLVRGLKLGRYADSEIPWEQLLNTINGMMRDAN